MIPQTATFLAARDFLLAHREDYRRAYDEFTWPTFDSFNWASDWFDAVAANQPRVAALRMVEEDGGETSVTYAQMSDRSKRAATWLDEQGLVRGDRVLLFLGNCVPLWELMLACIRLGLVMIPATTLLAPADVRDRIRRGNVRAVVSGSDDVGRIGDEAAHCIR
ncbi:MAG: AMP-binding protein, partial [Nocardioidaceae bacterium]